MKACALTEAVLNDDFRGKGPVANSALALAEMMQTVDRELCVLKEISKKNSEVLKWIEATRQRCDDIASQMKF
jgi:hypothetical protein